MEQRLGKKILKFFAVKELYMENVQLVSVIHNGMINPNIIVVLDIKYDDFEVNFYSKGKLNSEKVNLNTIAWMCKLTENSYAYNIKPKFMQRVHLEVVHHGQVVNTFKVKNSVFSTLRRKVSNTFTSIMCKEALRKYAIVLVPNKYKQKLYNRMLKLTTMSDKRVLKGLKIDNNYEYNYWIQHFEEFSKKSDLDDSSLVSIVVSLKNSVARNLKETLNSILSQSYQNFEICMCADATTKPEMIKVLNEFEKKDSRIKVLYTDTSEKFGSAINKSMTLSTGEYLAFVNSGDLISPHALNEAALVIANNDGVDMIYSDDDVIDKTGRRTNPRFKPDFSPDRLLGDNYIGFFMLVRKTIVDEIGGLRDDFKSLELFDFILRVTERTQNISNIPKVLYHYRNTNAVKFQDNVGKKLVEDTLKRRGLTGEVKRVTSSSLYNTLLNNNNEMITIIIPTRDGADMLEVCLNSIYEKTTYQNYEVIVVDNGSEKQETFQLFEKYQKHSNFKVIRMECAFNYSFLNNEAVKQSNGEYILLLNNDTSVITENWLEIMLGHARLEHAGAVGALLYYPNDTIQHCGVIAGISGGAVHAHVGVPRSKKEQVESSKIPTNFSAVTAACLMVNKDKFLQVGMLNEEDLTVAFNDVDLCLRLLEYGYHNILHPSVELYHYESISRGEDDTPEKKARFMKELRYLRKRHERYITHDPCYSINLSKVFPYELAACKEGEEVNFFNEIYN